MRDRQDLEELRIKAKPEDRGRAQGGGDKAACGGVTARANLTRIARCISSGVRAMKAIIVGGGIGWAHHGIDAALARHCFARFSSRPIPSASLASASIRFRTPGARACQASACCRSFDDVAIRTDQLYYLNRHGHRGSPRATPFRALNRKCGSSWGQLLGSDRKAGPARAAAWRCCACSAVCARAK